MLITALMAPMALPVGFPLIKEIQETREVQEEVEVEEVEEGEEVTLAA